MESNPKSDIDLAKQPAISRRRVLRGVGVGAFALGAGTGAYGMLYEPYHPVVERVTVGIPNLPASFDGFRIVQLSDLHVQPAFPADDLLPALHLAQAERPDLFVLTGDYINDDAPDPDGHMKACAQALAALDAPFGTIASFGNHDYPPPPADPPLLPFVTAGVRPLNDEIVPLKHGGDTIYIVGLRSFIKRPVTPGDVLAKTPKDAVRIVLWHEPDRAGECAAAGASLQLSGHTHGGQVVLPFVGPPFLPAGGRLYRSGLYHVGGMPLYVTRGVGLLNPRVRLNCPPEVTVLTLRRA